MWLVYLMAHMTLRNPSVTELYYGEDNTSFQKKNLYLFILFNFILFIFLNKIGLGMRGHVEHIGGCLTLLNFKSNSLSKRVLIVD